MYIRVDTKRIYEDSENGKKDRRHRLNVDISNCHQNSGEPKIFSYFISRIFCVIDKQIKE